MKKLYTSPVAECSRPGCCDLLTASFTYQSSGMGDVINIGKYTKDVMD